MTDNTKDPLGETLASLHTKLANRLLALIESDEVDAATLNAARQFLKDNGIDANRKPGSPLDKLARKVPQFPQGEEE